MSRIERFEDLIAWQKARDLTRASPLSPHGSVPRAQRSVPTAQSSSLSPRTLTQAGFTFVEILIVLVVIGILVTLPTPSFTTSVQRAREAALRENLFILRDVIDQHYADHGTYPPAL